MRWLDSLVECTDTTAVGTASFNAGHFAVTNGKISEAALVECVAQTVAAALGERARARGHSANAGIGNTGMLAAVSNFQIHSPPPLDKPLRIEVRELKRFGPMLLVAGAISCEGQPIASGELTLYG
jgi:predicted hotdog family 3-hydroxylacyl-ACP dehydratase